MFNVFMHSNSQIIFGDTQTSEDTISITNPMSLVMTQQHPSRPPQAMLVPLLPGDPSRSNNWISYPSSVLARVGGDIVSELEQKYVQATSRIQIAGVEQLNG